MPEPDLTDFLLLERLFLALGDKTRLKLLALMADGPVYVGFLVDRLGESQPKVSRHLAYMRQAGIVSTERDGKWIYYGIRYPEHSAARQILENVVSSLVAMRVDGEYIYFAQTQAETESLIRRGRVEAASGDEGMRYQPSGDDRPGYADNSGIDAPGQWDQSESESQSDGYGYETGPGTEEEMEVFLL